MKKLSILAFLFSFLAIINIQSSNKWKQGIVVDEFVFAKDSTNYPSVHAATIVETPSGLLTAFFGGQYEGHPDVKIYISKQNNKNVWSKPIAVANGYVSDTLTKACYNPVLFRYPDGEIILFYKIGKNVQDWSGYLIRSFDDGNSWTEPEALPEGFLGPIKNSPLLIGETLICPSSTENDGWQVHMEMTDNRGKTWYKSDQINSKPWNIIQPSILELTNGDLQVLCRSQDEHIIAAISKDKGKTWSSPFALLLPNNNSGTDAITLKSGKHLLVYNHVMAKQSAYQDKMRTPLNVALSDDGITWESSLVLEDSPISEYSYPSVIQANDGFIHIVYTWRREQIKHVKIDPKQLESYPIINNKWHE